MEWRSHILEKTAENVGDFEKCVTFAQQNAFQTIRSCARHVLGRM